MRDCESLNLKQRYIILNYSAGGDITSTFVQKSGRKLVHGNPYLVGGGRGHFWHFSKNFSLKMK